MTIQKAIVNGALGFGVASVCVFATVAFAERWMYRNLSPVGAYLAWVALFILVGGTTLGSLVEGRWRLPKFYLLFAIAFFAYAVGWMGAYFTLQGTVGEWAGSVLGAALMALVFAIAFDITRSYLKFALILFAANSLGYFIGSALNDRLNAPAGMVAWGIVYGLFLGAGIGAVLSIAQQESKSSV